jgi:hypothetical protein
MVLIAFRNTGSQVADAVTFDILQNGLHYTVTDHGRFAPGATVPHPFADDLDGISSEEPTCTVVNVHYVGG